MTRETTTSRHTSATIDDAPLVMPMHWECVDEAIPLDWRQNSKYMQAHGYAPHIGALDIETSTNGEFAWMYLWAFAIDDLIFYGRTVDDLKNFLRRLAARLDLRTDYRLATYIHNAKYDLSFLRCDLSLISKKQADFIARSRRQIIRCCMEVCFEVRDSAVYSEMPLEMMGMEIGMHKIDTYDYDLIRTPDTELTDEDLLYVGRDVHILTTYYRLQLTEYNGEYASIGDIPLTATGKDRRLISMSFTRHDNRSMSHGIRKMIYARQLKTAWTKKRDAQDHELTALDRDRMTLDWLRKAFFGGFCYCSALYSDTEIKCTETQRVISADLDACYASMMLTKKYPANRFRPMPSDLYPTTREQLDDMANGRGDYKGMAMLIKIRIKGIQARIPDFGFLPSWYRYHCKEEGMEKIKRTGRVAKADEMEIVLTDVDLRQYLRWYSSKQIAIISVIWTEYGVLPMYIRDVITMLYAQKKTAKREIKAKRAAGVATMADEIRYKYKKTMLARMYGVFVQDPIRMIYEWDEEAHDVKGRGQSQPETVQYSPVLYQWGVWVAAHARATLLDMCAKLGTTPKADGGGMWDKSIIYCDTDCIRWIDRGDDKQRFLHKYNAKMRSVMERMITPEVYKRIYDDFGVEIPADTLIGCGEWDIEVYADYKQIGIKQYAKIDNNGHFDCTISGLPKSQTYFDMFYDNADKMAEFNANLVIPSEYTRLKKTQYIDHYMEADVVDCTGVQRHVSSKCSVLLVPTDYRARDDDDPALDDFDLDTILAEYNKLGIEIDWDAYNYVMGRWDMGMVHMDKQGNIDIHP